MEVALKLRQCIEQLGGKAVDLWHIIGKGNEMIQVEEAQSFLKENGSDMELEKLTKAFKACSRAQESRFIIILIIIIISNYI